VEYKLQSINRLDALQFDATW